VPIYDFECPRCGDRFEEIVRPGAAAACPRCGEEETRRLYSPIAGLHKWHIDRRFAAESNARRSEREARRREGFAAARKRQRERASSP
jgi:putative FmdB family regulatory protein